MPARLEPIAPSSHVFEGLTSKRDTAQRQLFETQRKYMDALIEDYETYFQKLVDFDAQQQELIDRTKDLLDFIDEHILWIPSGKAVQPELLSDGRNAMAWLFGPANWVQLGRGLRDAATRLWPLHLLALILALLYLPFLRWVRPRIRALGQRAEKPDCAEFGPTAETLGLTLALAVWPDRIAHVLGATGQEAHPAQREGECHKSLNHRFGEHEGGVYTPRPGFVQHPGLTAFFTEDRDHPDLGTAGAP